MGHYWDSDYQDPHYYHNGEAKQADGFCTDFWFSQAMPPKWRKLCSIFSGIERQQKKWAKGLADLSVRRLITENVQGILKMSIMRY